MGHSIKHAGFAGELRISGWFAAVHHREIEALLRAEAGRVADDDPDGRIVSLDAAPPFVILVRTSTGDLAHQLGWALHKAFQGDMRFGVSAENNFAHVTWRRD